MIRTLEYKLNGYSYQPLDHYYGLLIVKGMFNIN